MKLIIAGGRDFKIEHFEWEKLRMFILGNNVTEIVSGGARGADKIGEDAAKVLNISLKIFPANWKAYGKSAGFRRNKQMAKYADGVLLFPGGKGTEHMYNIAQTEGLKIFDWRKNDSK